MTAKTTVTIEAVYPDGTDLTNRLVVVQLIHGGAGGTVDGQLIAERTIVPLTGDSDDWSVDLYPTAAISPAGCFYQFTIDNSSPTIVRDISVPSSGPVSWTDDAILLEDPAPPVTVPAAVSGDPLDVLRVKADGSGYELAPPEGGGGDALVISTAEPADPGVGADGAAWVRPPGDMRVFADFRVMPDGPIPDESNGWFPEDPATLVSFHSYPAPFQPCVVIDGAVQSDMVTTVDPGVDDSTRTGFAVIAEPGETGRVEWGHGGYAEPNDADMVAYVTSNVAISDNSGNAYLFDVVVGRVDPLTGDIDTGEAVSAGLRLIRDDLAAPTSIGWHPLDAIPVAGERFGFSWDNATGELVGYHNGEAVMTATDTTHDISTFTSVGMPLHQTNDDADEIAYFVRVAWIGVSAGDPVDPDSIGTHTWNGTAWVPALTADEVADIAAMRPATGGGGTVDVVSNVAANTILGRTTAGSGDSEELTASAARTLLGVPASGAIVDADVNASAAIARSKLATPGSARYASGGYYHYPCQKGDTRSVAPGALSFFPIDPEGPCIIDGLVVDVSTGAASGTAHLYLVSASPTTGRPTPSSVILASTVVAIVTTTSGSKVAGAFGAAYTSVPGVPMWGAIHALVGTATYRAVSTGYQMPPPIASSPNSSNNGMSCVNATGGGTSLLTSLSGLSFGTDTPSAPIISWRVA